MRVENMLYEYPVITQNIQKLNLELNEVIQTMQNARNTLIANAMKETPGGTDPADPTEKAAEKIVDIYLKQIHRLAVRIGELLDTKEIMDIALTKLSRDEYRVIELRYFNEMKWDSIIQTLKYSLRQCHRLRQMALEKLEKELFFKAQ